MRHLREPAPTFENWAAVHEAVADAYFPHVLRPMAGGSPGRSGLEVVDLGVARLAHMQFGATVAIRTEHPGAIAVNIQLAGRMESRVGRHRSYVTGPGQAVIMPADTPAHLPAWSPDCEVLGLRIESDHLAREYERIFACRDVRLPEIIDLSSPNGRAWLGLARTAFDNAHGEGRAIYQDTRWARSVASTLITGLLLTAIPEPAVDLRIGTRPRPVRRVMAAIDADPTRCWSAADLAELSGVGVRRLQQAFREHAETTPLGYLQEVRLDRVRADLLAGGGANVTDVAVRWGVPHLGRFSGEYRRRFGELPSRTLARSG